jgi:Rrf2 family transcriptional regulator, iron-sulfur cluster assembly transcription factor
MKMTAQEEYGLRCLLRLGRTDSGSLTIPEIAKLEGISAANVAKMMRLLRKGGLVRSARGKDGGYTLARIPRDIAIGEALAVLGGRLYDGRFCDRHSGSTASCANLTDCSIRGVWQRMQQAVDDVLAGLTLHDLICGDEAPAVAPTPAGRLPLPMYGTRG